jgi:hypothetical protein
MVSMPSYHRCRARINSQWPSWSCRWVRATASGGSAARGWRRPYSKSSGTMSTTRTRALFADRFSHQ